MGTHAQACVCWSKYTTICCSDAIWITDNYQAFEKRTSKSLKFRCFHYSYICYLDPFYIGILNVQYSDPAYSFLEKAKKLFNCKIKPTQIRIWAMARFPIEDARCRGVLPSRGLTGVFTSSWLAWAKTRDTDFMSDLWRKNHKHEFLIAIKSK